MWWYFDANWPSVTENSRVHALPLVDCQYSFSVEWIACSRGAMNKNFYGFRSVSCRGDYRTCVNCRPLYLDLASYPVTAFLEENPFFTGWFPSWGQGTKDVWEELYRLGSSLCVLSFFLHDRWRKLIVYVLWLFCNLWYFLNCMILLTFILQGKIITFLDIFVDFESKLSPNDFKFFCIYKLVSLWWIWLVQSWF